MIHKKQRTNFSCVYTCLSMLFGGDESYYWKTIRKDGKQDGAHDWEVSKYLKSNNIEHKLIDLENNPWWLVQLSHRFPIYLSCFIKIKPKRGRPMENHHATVIYEGKLFNPSNDFVIDFGEWNADHEYNIKSCIVIFRENKNFGKNK